jgi:hypothetical protein
MERETSECGFKKRSGGQHGNLGEKAESLLQMRESQKFEVGSVKVLTLES